MTVNRVNPIYLFRRKGHPNWATCDFQRHAELSDHALFETRLACDMDDYDALLSLNAELLEALERVLPLADRFSETVGGSATESVVFAGAALAKARSAS